MDASLYLFNELMKLENQKKILKTRKKCFKFQFTAQNFDIKVSGKLITSKTTKSLPGSFDFLFLFSFQFFVVRMFCIHQTFYSGFYRIDPVLWF